jgi:hypothetical protein
MRQINNVYRALIMFGLFAAHIHAQPDLAAITGTLSDTHGDPIPHALISILQNATMLVRATETTGAGGKRRLSE